MVESTDQLKDFILKCLEEKKADDIIVLDLEGKTLLAKYMIFASGRSVKNIAAIAEFVSLELKHKINLKTNIEGLSTRSEWVLVDAGDIIVHIFHPEARSEIRLEEMWQKKSFKN